jgi:pimeloyl-ACP methyl ester carboxylesterase
MSTRSFAAFGLACATVLAASPVAAAPHTAAPRTAALPPTIAWQPCAEDQTAECGTVSVPVDWSQPRGARVDLALARRPATDPAARIGALVFNPGGPGISGRNVALFQPGTFSDALRRRFDIVGFDPRGAGLSNPVMCSSAVLAQEPSLVLTGQADFDGWLAYNQRLRADCRARTGPLYDHVDTLSVVRDLDVIRAALGESTLTFYGVSGGTLIAQQYAERYPHRVRAFAADSFLDHTLGTRSYLDSSAVATQDSFNEFAAWNDRTPSSPLHGQDVRAVWRHVLDRTERGEIPHPEQPQRALRQEELIFFAQSIFYGPDWPILALVLAAWHAGQSFPLPAEPPPPAPEAIPYPIPAIFCGDYHLPIRDYAEYARHLRRTATIAPDILYSPIAMYTTLACLGTPTPIPNPQQRLDVAPLPTPLLILNARHDPATAYPWAVHGAQQLGDNAVLLTYDGWGHGAYGRTPCTTDTVDIYLISRTPPAAGTHCPAADTQRQASGVTANGFRTGQAGVMVSVASFQRQGT